MTAASALLREVRASVRLDGGRLLAAANSPPKVLARLREHKSELVEILRGDRCRHCGDQLAWPGPAGVVLDDGTAECQICADAEVWRLLEAGRSAVESPDALADPAEVMLRGEIT